MSWLLRQGADALRCLLRALAPLAGGGGPVGMGEPPVAAARRPCPVCGASLEPGPHTHERAMVWATEDPREVLVTNLQGGKGVRVRDYRP